MSSEVTINVRVELNFKVPEDHAKLLRQIAIRDSLPLPLVALTTAKLIAQRTGNTVVWNVDLNALMPIQVPLKAADLGIIIPGGIDRSSEDEGKSPSPAGEGRGEVSDQSADPGLDRIH